MFIIFRRRRLRETCFSSFVLPLLLSTLNINGHFASTCIYRTRRYTHWSHYVYIGKYALHGLFKYKWTVNNVMTLSSPDIFIHDLLTRIFIYTAIFIFSYWKIRRAWEHRINVKIVNPIYKSWVHSVQMKPYQMGERMCVDEK